MELNQVDIRSSHLKATEQGNKKSSETTKLMDLPVEILLNIFLRLPAKSIVYVQCASKALFNTVVINNRYLLKLHTGLLVAIKHRIVQVAQLMVYARRGDAGLVSLQSLKYDGNTLALGMNNVITVSTTGETAQYEICFVYFNLFCLKEIFGRLDKRVFLINPLRGEVLRLPVPPSEIYVKYFVNSVIQYDFSGMGFDNITNTHNIVRFTRLMSKYLVARDYECKVAQILVLGEGSWREIAAPTIGDLPYERNTCAFGDMHWLVHLREGNNYGIYSFDFKKEKFDWTPHLTLGCGIEYVNLITLRGSMAVTDITVDTYMSIEIWVMKDYDKKEWTLDYIINGHKTAYPLYTLMFPPICGEWEHGIYMVDSWIRNGYISISFLDLRYNSIKSVMCDMCPVKDESVQLKHIFSYTESLISLKDYGSLVKAKQDNVSYDNRIKEEEESFGLTKHHIVQGISTFVD